MMRPSYEKSKQQKIQVWFTARSKYACFGGLTLVTPKECENNVDFQHRKLTTLEWGLVKKG